MLVTGSMITVPIGTDVSNVSIGRDTLTGGGVGVGEDPAEATPRMSKEVVMASVTLFQFL